VFIAASTFASAIRPLQFLVLLVAGLFFLRVVRVVMLEVRPPEEVSAPRQRRSNPLALTFIEPLDREGERIEITESLVMGRSPSSDVTFSDSYLSSQHARFSVDNGELLVEDLGSTNGTFVNQEPVIHRTVLRRGDIVQVGGGLFEVVR